MMREINYQLMTVHRQTHEKIVGKRYLQQDTFASSPWIIIFISILLIGAISYTFKDDMESDFYFGSLIYAIIGALFVTGSFGIVLIRYLLYRAPELTPQILKASLMGALLVVAFIAFIVSTVFLIPFHMPVSYKVFYILFFILLSCSFELFILQSTLPVFPLLCGIFFILLLCVPFVGYIGRGIAGSVGYILGIALTQAIIFFVQWFLFSNQFGHSLNVRSDYLAFMLKNPDAIAIGILSVYGVFADKLVFWIFGAPHYELPVFQMTHNYTIAFALAMTAILPAFVYFMIKVEKELHRRFRDFYASIQAKADLSSISVKKQEFVDYILSASSTILKILVISVFLFTYFATQLYTLLGLELEDIPLFRTALWGNSLFILFTCICILLSYIEFNKTVCVLYAVFAFLNTLFPLLNLFYFHIHPMYIFPAVALISLLTALAVSVHYIKHLVAIQFRRPPLGFVFRRVKKNETNVYLLKKGLSFEKRKHR